MELCTDEDTLDCLAEAYARLAAGVPGEASFNVILDSPFVKKHENDADKISWETSEWLLLGHIETREIVVGKLANISREQSERAGVIKTQLASYLSMFLDVAIEGDRFIKDKNPSKSTVSVLRFLSKLIQDHHSCVRERRETRWRPSSNDETYPGAPNWNDMENEGFRRPTGEVASEDSDKVLEMCYKLAVKYEWHRRVLDEELTALKANMTTTDCARFRQEKWDKPLRVNTGFELGPSFDMALQILRDRQHDTNLRLKKVQGDLALASGNQDLQEKFKKIKMLEAAMESNSTDTILKAMVVHSDNKPAMGIPKAYNEAGRGTPEAARYNDRAEVVVSLGNVGSSANQVLACQTCGCAVVAEQGLEACAACSIMSCTPCVRYSDAGCRGCNGGQTFRITVPSNHPIGLCGDDLCCGTGESENSHPHYCYRGCYGCGVRY